MVEKSRQLYPIATNSTTPPVEARPQFIYNIKVMANPKADTKTNQAAYEAEHIQVLEGLEPVRKRPGMYIGSTGQEGLHHLITEIVNNSMDEAIGGFANHIKLEFFNDGSVAVYDNGRGIPYGVKAGYNVSALELAFTKLHAGGKFGGGGYKVSSGLHGVGASVVNALSQWTRVIVKRGKDIVIQEYVNGGKVVRPVEKLDPKKPVTKIKGAEWSMNLENWEYESGTIVQFLPDSTIFETTNFNFKFFVSQLREYAYLTSGIKFELIDHRNDDQHYTFYFEGGIKAYLQALNRNKTPLNQNIFSVKKEQDGVLVEAALQYNDSFNETVLCFANHLRNSEGGTHATGFRGALTRTINEYARKSGVLKEKDANLTGDDLREGLTAIVSINMDSSELQFEGQTKAKLGNSNVRQIVETIVKESLDSFFEENPRDAQAIIEKNILALKARMAAKAARDTVIRKSALEGGGVLPGKLADCSEKDPTKTELFIVEGDSAGGCFFGATTISLADGRSLSFEEIVKEQAEGKNHFCYTVLNTGHIGIAPLINARVTKTNAKVIKVTLDTNEEIICTPEHLFMLRDGNYLEAHKLTINDSLMPLYRKLSSKLDHNISIDGYEMTWDPKSEKWMFTHKLSDLYNLSNTVYTEQDGGTCHHVDFHKKNNNPTNLVRMKKNDHFELHRNHIEKTLHTPEIIEKSRKAKQTKEFKQKMSARMQEPNTRALLSKNAKKQWSDNEYKRFMKSKWLDFYYSNPKYRKMNNKKLNEVQKAYWSSEENRIKQSNKTKNYFEINIYEKDFLSRIATEQWQNKDLLKWRSQKTKEQWTEEFRIQRKKAYNATYLNKSLKVLREVYDQYKELREDIYNQKRVELKDRSIIRMSTICERFFDGNQSQLEDAVKNFNHKIKSIEYLTEKYDVYDAEVPETHNFALASGIFVHNSAKQGRNRKIQAILPIFGKPLNTERAHLDKVVDNDRFKALIIAIGAGIGEQYNPEKLRYNKLIVMADADTDGSHIATLHLTFFYRHMTEILANGHVYLAVPPLYKAIWGKEKKYLFDDAERTEFLKTAEGKKAVIQRFKGLGEMNAQELWETTMDPETRHLKQITIDDAAKADEVFTMLMGDEVPPRKRFIQTHAKQANIDLV